MFLYMKHKMCKKVRNQILTWLSKLTQNEETYIFELIKFSIQHNC